MKQKAFLIISIMIATALFIPASAFAHCPLCTIGIGFLAVIAELLGVNLVVVGLFVGAFAVSTGLWMGRKLRWNYRYKVQVVTLVSFILTVIPLQRFSNQYYYFPLLLFGEFGSTFNRLYYLDHFTAGAIMGGILTLASLYLNNSIKSIKGRVLFPFQGVVVTLVILAAAGIFMQLFS